MKNSTKNQKWAWMLFIIYLITLTYFMFFAESFGRVPSQEAKYSYNLEVLKEIRRFYDYRQQLGMKAFLLNVVGNIAGFIPFGFFTPIISRRCKYFFNTVLLSFLLSLSIEITQLVFRVGSFDVDDLLLNTIGGIIGFVGYQLIQMMRRNLHGKR